MKRALIIAPAAIMMMLATACDAMWGTSFDMSPDDYTIGVSTAYPASGIYNPLYWGNDYYPGIGYYPGIYPSPVRPVRPGWGIGGNRPIQPPTRPGTGAVGNVRPGSGAGTPVPLPDNRPVSPGNSIVPPAGTFPNISGSEPGVVMPPQGSGMRPGRK